MSVEDSIRNKLKENLTPSFFEVINESHNHNVPANSETHFKVTVASTAFEGLRSVQRHQKVYGLLQEEMAGPVHALALHTYTPEEWQEKGMAPESPNCLGGGADSA